MTTTVSTQKQTETTLQEYAGLCEHSYKEKEKIYAIAVENKSFKILLSYNCLLMRWQRYFPQDLKRIAKISSHRLGNHRYCKSDNECTIIEEFLKKQALGQKELFLEEKTTEIHIENIAKP